MAKPTRDYTWATDATYAAGIYEWSGDPTKIVPSAGERAVGWEPEHPVSAQFLNEQVSSIAEHLDYVHGVIEGTVDTDGVSRSIEVMTEDVTLSTLTSGAPEWYRSPTGVVSLAYGAAASIDLRKHVPYGSVVTSIDALVSPGAARPALSRMELRLSTLDVDWSTPGVPGFSSVASQEDDGTTSIQVVTLGSLNYSVVDGVFPVLTVFSGGSPFVADGLIAFRINYVDYRAIR